VDRAASRRGFKARAIDLYRFSEGARLAAAGIGTDTFRKWVGLRWRSARPVARTGLVELALVAFVND
jgi:hypothetical protein